MTNVWAHFETKK